MLFDIVVVLQYILFIWIGNTNSDRRHANLDLCYTYSVLYTTIA